MNNCFIFPSLFLWWTKIENHSEIKKQYLPIFDNDYNQNKLIYNQNKTWWCDVTSSFFYKYNVSPIFDDNFINQIVWNPLDKMLSEFRSNLPQLSLPVPYDSKLEKIWYNRYEKSNWQEIHSHTDTRCVFSGIYLFDLNEPNTTVFYNQNTIKCFSCSSDHYRETESISEGNVLIFPSELAHFVSPSSKPRTTISFNIVSNYE